MKKKWKPGFSETVLVRKKKRSDNRWFVEVIVFWAIVVLVYVAPQIVLEYRIKVTAIQSLVKPSAPESRIAEFNDDGVPSRILVNGESWDVYQVAGFRGYKNLEALTSCRVRAIFYTTKHDPGQLRVEVMHEIWHAGGCLHGGDKWWNSPHPTFAQHPGVYHLGDFSVDFPHSNPVFMKWLMNW